MHLSIMLKDSLKLINHSLASMTGEIFMMFVQGGNEPIIETNFLLKNCENMESLDLFFGSWKCACTLIFQDLSKKIVELPQFIPKNATHVVAS